MHFFIGNPTVDLEEYFSTLRYYRKGSFYIVRKGHIKIVYFESSELFTIKEINCYIEINCYMNSRIMAYVNDFLRVLGVGYELYIKEKELRIRGEERYVLWD